MSEPEEVILEGAHLATVHAARLWRRRRAGAEAEPLGLADVRGRIELFVAALCPGAPPIVVAEPPAPAHLLGRLMRRIPTHLVERAPLASTDGARIRLPRRLPAATEAETLELYRVLALGQALRAIRGTAAHLPGDPAHRDLFLLLEALAVDHAIATEVPGLARVLRRERRHGLASRPAPRRLGAAERAVEELLREALRAPPAAPPPGLPLCAAPAESLLHARRLLSHLPATAARYRGLPPVPLWGRVDPHPEGARAAGPSGGASTDDPTDSRRARTLKRRPRLRRAPEDEDDQGPGLAMVPIDDREEKAEDPMGLTRPTDRDDEADPDELAESLEELEEARLVRTPERAREVLASEDPPTPPHAPAPPRAGAGPGVRYPEWDYRLEAYREGHVVVRLEAAELAPPARAAALLRENAAVVRRVRREFERLRPRPQRLGRQPDGPEVDMDAYVSALADRLAGGTVEDRLYETHRPQRRELAIALLVDASASTDSWVSQRRRIVDVERDALLVVAEALDALGDRYAVIAFSGEGPGGVRVRSLKGYGEPYGAAVRRRIAALEPDRYTRLGAALRHVATGLAREAAHHRLLLVLSDGKPNDFDEYEGRYGVEDARQAVVEARREGIHPFCLTVDRQAPAYMPRIFGATGFAPLRRAESLPRVLVEVLRRLVVR